MENVFEIKQNELENATSKEVVNAVVKILDSKKANGIKALKIDNKTIIAALYYKKKMLNSDIAREKTFPESNKSTNGLTSTTHNALFLLTR